MQGYGSELELEEDEGNHNSATSQCFVCDSVVCGRATPLLMGIAPYTKIALPTKIGQLMGDRCMVIVTAEDVLCHRCASLIIHLDKLEVDIGVVKKALIGYLKMKYNLCDDEESGSHLLDYPYMYGLEEEVRCKIGLKSYLYRSHPRSSFMYPSLKSIWSTKRCPS
jgi:hypothetical protein